MDTDIKLTICKTRNHQVRIGIDAPRHIAVMREELFKKEKPQVNIKNKRRKCIIFPEP
ncbi:MAG: carbon storage regulator [Gammaproteobacteria bacterium]|nr:carbon storage regulator [Gammaproteobacteria bacterium]